MLGQEGKSFQKAADIYLVDRQTDRQTDLEDLEKKKKIGKERERKRWRKIGQVFWPTLQLTYVSNYESLRSN